MDNPNALRFFLRSTEAAQSRKARARQHSCHCVMLEMRINDFNVVVSCCCFVLHCIESVMFTSMIVFFVPF